MPKLYKFRLAMLKSQGLVYENKDGFRTAQRPYGKTTCGESARKLTTSYKPGFKEVTCKHDLSEQQFPSEKNAVNCASVTNVSVWTLGYRVQQAPGLLAV